ncbi:LOW QUALITY PROTEIN: protein c-Fos-like [Lethenteron reissneri]|uniref:LOW QUALITY PROTEIN: protein c-Fos-like n=1 Tax=Lethenteron reissneri TaxID=7753 RepID=UPI002AB6C53C|nr:LOW QUALITY PROTEIN: protein c-Fos-like [Lethenteron reissneri]
MMMMTTTEMYSELRTDSAESPSRSSVSPAESMYLSSLDSYSHVGSPAAHSAGQDYSVMATVSGDTQWLLQTAVAGRVHGGPARRGGGPGRTHPYGHGSRGPGSFRGDKEPANAEEEERRRIRRERNKQAAAKCRNRRRELTETLEAETAKLAAEQSAIRADLERLQKERDELELVLAAHEPTCRLQHEPDQNVPSANSPRLSPGLPAPRPASLPLPPLQLKQEPPSPPSEHQYQRPAPREHEQASGRPPRAAVEPQQQHVAPPGPFPLEAVEPLHTPVVSFTPGITPCSGSGAFVFTYPSLAGLQDFLHSEPRSCASALRRRSSSGSGDLGGEALLSPTILSL